MQKWYVLVYYIAYLMNYDIHDCFSQCHSRKTACLLVKTFLSNLFDDTYQELWYGTYL